VSPIAICTVCSREKSDDADPVPARERYLGSHVALVAQYAAEQGLPFFILSGVYGFISAEAPILGYDHLFSESEVAALAPTVYLQLKKLGIEKIHFYTKTKPGWIPYRKVLEIATATEGLAIQLHIHELSEGDSPPP